MSYVGMMEQDFLDKFMGDGDVTRKHPSLLLKTYHGGYVVIRLALAGHKQANRPFYRIVAAHNKRARDGKYIEQLGTYDPLPNVYNEKLVSFNFDRLKYWIGCGAHPTKPVAKLLGLAGFFPLHPMTITEAERQKAQTQVTQTEEGSEQEQKKAEAV
uniref:Small ribosomal subunit protein bS16m n=1 Tax=Cynoglossus semilaevis TaxID=244447 RepID=A0A3P8X660_CYNSE